MSNQNQEQRGCGSCDQITVHAPYCSLNKSTASQSPVLDSERSPTEREFRCWSCTSIGHHDPYCDFKGTVTADQVDIDNPHGDSERSPERHEFQRQRFQDRGKVGTCRVCGQPRDAEVHQVDESYAESRRKFQSAEVAAFNAFDAAPQPPPEAARCPDCHHERRFFNEVEGRCMCPLPADDVDTLCGHRCTFSPPEATQQELHQLFLNWWKPWSQTHQSPHRVRGLEDAWIAGYSERNQTCAAVPETRLIALNQIVTVRVKQGRFGGDDPNDWLTVERRDGMQGTRWAVCDKGLCLNRDGEWEWEPQPSSRDDEFLVRCRFATFDEAYQVAQNCQPYQPEIQDE